ncbi:ligand-binding sensor domain-containing protein [Paraflavitalea speifideaquila]|uniref:ligand-binding sensor domain-containing protein n=1 Tax=Paraflavitalea speifideaquila TaxID=3076558 RepID=UPI0028ED003F|nr:two-component regulator propeller domain-containing protein [Paraflavitalea speifideiaquila]
MKCPLTITFFAGIFLAGIYSLHAQTDFRLAFTQKVGPAQGLSSYNASKIVQDRYGFIWIATQDGLNRFDGNQFIIYNKTSDTDHRLLGNMINTIQIDSMANLLWVTTSYGGLNGIDLITGRVIHTLRNDITPKGFPGGWLKCFTICAGLIWIGTENGIVVYNPQARAFMAIEHLPVAGTQPKANVSFLYADGYNNVWAYLPGTGLLAYQGRTGKLLHTYIPATFGQPERKSFYSFLGGWFASMIPAF